MECTERRFRIDPKKVHLLKFLLEGYEGIATVTTEDPEKGVVIIRVPPGRQEEAEDAILRICEDTELGPE